MFIVAILMLSITGIAEARNCYYSLTREVYCARTQTTHLFSYVYSGPCDGKEAARAEALQMVEEVSDRLC